MSDMKYTCTTCGGRHEMLTPCPKEEEESITGHDTPNCDVCHGKTALIAGSFYYEAHEEPYSSGVEETAKVDGGECWAGGYKCDNCGHLQDLWTE